MIKTKDVTQWLRDFMRDETMESDYLLVGQRRHYGMVGDRNKQQRKTHSNRQKTKKCFITVGCNGSSTNIMKSYQIMCHVYSSAITC